MRKVYFLLLFLFLFGNMILRADSLLVQRIDSLLESVYDSSAPGGALLIANGDKILYDKGFGIADMESQEPINGDTNFNIASISKQFTAAAILKLQQEGLLSIDDTVDKFFPEFKSSIWSKVTLKHLMSHSSGVPDDRPRTDRNFTLFVTDEQSIEYMQDLDYLKFEPGTQYDYINPTFQVLYGVIERVSKMSFEEFQKTSIFTPSDMKNVRYFSPEIEIHNMAHAYICPFKKKSAPKTDSDFDKKIELDPSLKQFKDQKDNIWQEYDYGEETFFATKSDGGIYTSTHELFKWERALANNKCLSKESLEMAYSPITKVSGSPYSSYQNRPYTHYGLGWFQDNTPNRPVKVYHTGDNGGFQAYLSKYLGTDVIVIMLENRNDLDRWSMQMKIERILSDEGLLNTNL